MDSNKELKRRRMQAIRLGIFIAMQHLPIKKFKKEIKKLDKLTKKYYRKLVIDKCLKP